MQNQLFLMNLDRFWEDSRAREGIPEAGKLISLLFFDFHRFSLDFSRIQGQMGLRVGAACSAGSRWIPSESEPFKIVLRIDPALLQYS